MPKKLPGWQCLEVRPTRRGAAKANVAPVRSPVRLALYLRRPVRRAGEMVPG